MDKARIAGRKSMIVALEVGEHYWCACGRSESQPYCDGSHVGTGIEPLAFTVEEPREAHMCLCKQAKKKPFCDGTHRSLPTDVDELDICSCDDCSCDKPSE